MDSENNELKKKLLFLAILSQDVCNQGISNKEPDVRRRMFKR